MAEDHLHDGPTSRHRTLHGYVVEWLGTRIVSGEFPEGAKLSTEELATRIGVSRGGLREVFQALAAKGLVVARPRIGTVVRDRSEWNLLDPQLLEWRGRIADDRFIKDLLQLRLIIEPAVAELAAAVATPDEVTAIDDACRRMEANAAGLPDTEEAFVNADVDFHITLLRACGNELVAQLATLLETRLKHSIEVTAHVPEEVARVLPMHRAVTEAVRAGHGDAAAQAMCDLLATTVETIDVLSRK